MSEHAYSEKIDAVIYSDAISTPFSEALDEGAEFAIAILDQAGYSVEVQEGVRKLLAKHDPSPIGGKA